jgi:hypothetical protein
VVDRVGGATHIAGDMIWTVDALRRAAAWTSPSPRDRSTLVYVASRGRVWGIADAHPACKKNAGAMFTHRRHSPRSRRVGMSRRVALALASTAFSLGAVGCRASASGQTGQTRVVAVLLQRTYDRENTFTGHDKTGASDISSSRCVSTGEAVYQCAVVLKSGRQMECRVDYHPTMRSDLGVDCSPARG